MKVKEKVKEKVKPKAVKKICSDYDSECIDVANPVSCWLGNLCTPIGIADGICPIIHNSN